MSRNIHQWINDYGVSHQNKVNKKLHWICVPLIMFTLLGLLSMIKFEILSWNSNFKVSLGHILIFLAAIFYLSLSFKISIGMIIISLFQILIIHYLEINMTLFNLAVLYVTVFIIAWIGQFIGHKIEGQKPSFFEDLQFLLIGPAWLLSFVYKKMNIKY